MTLAVYVPEQRSFDNLRTADGQIFKSSDRLVGSLFCRLPHGLYVPFRTQEYLTNLTLTVCVFCYRKK